MEIHRNFLILVIARALWIVWEVESYAPSTSSLLRRLATTKTSKKPFRKKSMFFGFRKSVFRHFSWIFEGIDNFRRLNQFSREILLQTHLFWSPCDQKLQKNDLCCENLASASPTRARPNLYLWYIYGLGGVCGGHLRVILNGEERFLRKISRSIARSLVRSLVCSFFRWPARSKSFQEIACAAAIQLVRKLLKSDPSSRFFGRLKFAENSFIRDIFS